MALYQANQPEVVTVPAPRKLVPFGLLFECQTSGAKVTDLPTNDLLQHLFNERLLVLRGFAPLSSDELVRYCEGLGKLLLWDFGALLDMSVRSQPKNYLFTAGEVPFHWDGAFARQDPSYIVFQCVEPPSDKGGETLFCDTIRVVEGAPEHEQDEWRSVVVTYMTEKIAHYGGSVTVPLVSCHPKLGRPRIRYAEPLDSARFLNPLVVEVAGLGARSASSFHRRMRASLYGPEVCYTHRWSAGDIVIADNHALLHGRKAFHEGSGRRLQRVHVL